MKSKMTRLLEAAMDVVWHRDHNDLHDGWLTEEVGEFLMVYYAPLMLDLGVLRDGSIDCALLESMLRELVGARKSDREAREVLCRDQRASGQSVWSWEYE
jgi:hypothetical protein